MNNPEQAPYPQEKPRPGTRAAVQEELSNLENQEQTYDKLEILAPKVIGQGAESTVLQLNKVVESEVARHRNVVAKIDLASIEHTLRDNIDNEQDLTHLSEQRQLELTNDINKIKDRTNKLKSYFPGSTLPERFYIEPVPVNKDLLRAASKFKPGSSYDQATDQLQGDTIEIPALVRLQLKVPDEVLNSPDTLDLSGGYRERESSVTEEEYSAWNKDLIAGEGLKAEEYLKSIDLEPEAGPFHKLIEQIKDDTELRTVIQKFAESAINYTANTDEILDIFGAKNILTNKDPKTGKWQVTFMDALYPIDKAWSKFQLTAAKADPNLELSSNARSAGVHLLNYSRNINALAAISGSEQRLRLPDSILALDKKILKQARVDYGLSKPGDASETIADYSDQVTELLSMSEDDRATERMPAATPAEADDQQAA